MITRELLSEVLLFLLPKDNEQLKAIFELTLYKNLLISVKSKIIADAMPHLGKGIFITVLRSIRPRPRRG
jgi:hypothetical protein